MPFDLNDPELKALIDEAAKKHAAELVANETAGLKRSRDEILREKKALEARVSGLPQDFDPEEWTKLKTAAEQAREEREKAAGNFDKLKQELVQKHADEQRKLAERAERAEKRYQSYFIESAITQAIAKADGIPQILMPHVLSNVRFVPGENGGEDAVVVVGKDGQPRVKDGKGAVIGLDDLLSELKADEIFSRGFKASGATGGGAGGSGGANGGAGGKTMKRAAFEALPPMQRAEFTRAGGTLTD